MGYTTKAGNDPEPEGKFSRPKQYGDIYRAYLWVRKKPKGEAGVDVVGETRERFLLAVEHYVPEALQNLEAILHDYEKFRDQILAAAARRFREIRSSEYARPQIEQRECERIEQLTALETTPWPTALRENCERWGQRFNLTKGGHLPGWVRNQLAATLSYWVQIPGSEVGKHWGPLVGPKSPEIVSPMYIKYQQKYIGQGLERKLRSKSLKLELYEPIQMSAYEWAARFQVGRERIAKLGRSCTVDGRTIQNQVNEVLRTVGLDRRREKKGPVLR